MFDNIRGVITFEAVTDEPETFINALKSSSVQVSEIKYKKGRLYGKIYRNSFAQICDMAEKSGIPISIAEKRGSIFTIRKYRARYGISIGIILAFLMVAYLSNIVMSVEIYGNEMLTDKQIASLLNDCGIKIGAFIPNIDLRDAERQIVSSSDDIAWIGIRSSGCIIEAEVSETEPSPEMVSTRTPCNVISSQNAQIVDIKNVHMGMLIPMLYDGVQKGDLLISGTVDDGKGGVYFAHAMGEIIGRYNEKVTFSQPFVDEITNYSDKVTRKYLNLFGLRIPLFVGKNDFGQCEYDESISYFRILNIELPIGMIISEYHPYQTESILYSPEKARQILEDKIKMYEKNFYSGNDISIIDKEVFFSETDTQMTVTVKYTIEGDIGITQEIMAK